MPRLDRTGSWVVGAALAGLAVASTGCGGGSAGRSVTPARTAPAATSARLCDVVAPADIQSQLGLAVRSPERSVHGAVVVCTYAAAAGLQDPGVSIHVDTASDAARFAASRTTFADDGETTQTLSGLGTEAFSSSVHSDGRVVSTVVARSGSMQLWITAGSPLPQVETLARDTLSRL